MKKRSAHIISLAIIIVLFSIAKFSHGIGKIKPLEFNNEPQSVRYVIDGDTIALWNGKKVRYIGIDTAEIGKREGSRWIYDPQPYAEEARDFNKKLTDGKLVRLEFDVQRMDRYKRILAYVFIGDKMVNIEMVRQGYAMLYTYPPNVKYVEKFIEAQKEAMQNKRGIWSYLENTKISTNQASENIGKMVTVEAKVLNTYLTEKVLILNFKDNFKVAIFRDNLLLFPKLMSRSPDTYFKGKSIRVYGVIKEYKGFPEIVIHDPSQLEILE